MTRMPSKGLWLMAARAPRTFSRPDYGMAGGRRHCRATCGPARCRATIGGNDALSRQAPPPAAAVVARRGLFTEPDFRRLWFVGLVVFLVRWLETLVTGLFTWNATGSAFLVAMMTMLRLLPMGLFGAFLGAWAERVEGRTALLLTVLGCLLSSLAVALLANAGALAVWHLGALSFVNGLGWAADNPVRRLMIGQAVGAERMGP